MRKILLSILLCFACLATMHAERPRPFEVKRLRSWAPEYLTITTVYQIGNLKLYNLENCPVVEYYNLWCDNNLIESNHEKLWLKAGIVIRSIDGQDAKNMSEQTFYNILAQKDEHEMYVYDPDIGGYESPYDLRIKFTITEPPTWMQQCLPYSQDKILKGEKIPGLNVTEENMLKKAKEDLQKRNPNTKLYWDKDFDWFSIQTYDFIPTQDPLVDKALMEEFIKQFPRLKRNEDNPDVLIRLTKDEQQSINSTYVPPTVKVVNEGATTRKVYNFFGTDYSYQTQQKNRVIKEGDYVQTTSTEDLYLEIVMLDAKRIKQATPPIIYQMKYKGHFVNRTMELETVYRNAISWIRDPAYFSGITKYCIASYKSNWINKYKEKRRDEVSHWSNGLKCHSETYAYFRVYPTNLANWQVLGQSRFVEGDVIERHLYESFYHSDGSRNWMRYTYYMAEHDGRKIKKKDRKQHWVTSKYAGDGSWIDEDVEQRWACVTFNIWRFAIDEE